MVDGGSVGYVLKKLIARVARILATTELGRSILDDSPKSLDDVLRRAFAFGQRRFRDVEAHARSETHWHLSAAVPPMLTLVAIKLRDVGADGTAWSPISHSSEPAPTAVLATSRSSAGFMEPRSSWPCSSSASSCCRESSTTQ